MLIHNTVYIHRSGSRMRLIALMLLWCLGLWSGCELSSLVDSRSLLHSVFTTRLTLSGLLVVRIFPLAVTIAAYFFHARFPLYFLAFLKAYCISFVLGCVFASFGESAWLIQFLLLFSDVLISLPLIWLWIQILRQDGGFVPRCCFAVLFWSVLLTFADFFIAADLLTALF